MIFFRTGNRAVIFSVAGIILLYFLSCRSKDNKSDLKKYSSLSDSTTYVGIGTCKQCHSDKFETFSHTGMGLSFDKASKKKSSADFKGHEVIVDRKRNLNYHPYWKNDSLFLVEFRIENGDTVYKHDEKISWIVGSGQHTNSHMVNYGGYVYQAPATFYTQRRKWDLPPGFEGGFNSRFSRMIGLECMSCHNAFPKFVMGSENKFEYVPNGIDCERCHGPGSIHVKEKLAGHVVDVSKEIDYTIVNPSKLPIDLQLDVCQRCHIQGNAVLQDGKSFLDFRPGMRLSEVMNVYMPLFKGDDETHIMASHAERMKMSRCFLVSAEKAERLNNEEHSLMPYKNAMTCVTCHDPHVSVRQTDQSIFNGKCISCHHAGMDSLHASVTVCMESMKNRMKIKDNCVSCHMPKSGTIDIPHVSTTDHWIRKPVKRNDVKRIKEFAGLVCINNNNDGNRSRGNAFLSYYEKFSSNPVYLDSAKKYFSDENKDSVAANFGPLVHWAFLKNDFSRVIQYVRMINHTLDDLDEKSYSNSDAWTAYRIGESFNSQNDFENATLFFQRSVDLAPYHPDFRNKLAGAQQDMGSIAEARKNYEFIIRENPSYASAYVSLGFLILTSEGNTKRAGELYDKALALDPDNLQAFLNKAGIMILLGDKIKARLYVKEVLKRDEKNARARMLLKELI